MNAAESENLSYFIHLSSLSTPNILITHNLNQPVMCPLEMQSGILTLFILKFKEFGDIEHICHTSL